MIRPLPPAQIFDDDEQASLVDQLWLSEGVGMVAHQTGECSQMLSSDRQIHCDRTFVSVPAKMCSPPLGHGDFQADCMEEAEDDDSIQMCNALGPDSDLEISIDNFFSIMREDHSTLLDRVHLEQPLYPSAMEVDGQNCLEAENGPVDVFRENVGSGEEAPCQGIPRLLTCNDSEVWFEAFVDSERRVQEEGSVLATTYNRQAPRFESNDVKIASPGNVFRQIVCGGGEAPRQGMPRVLMCRDLERSSEASLDSVGWRQQEDSFLATTWNRQGPGFENNNVKKIEESSACGQEYAQPVKRSGSTAQSDTVAANELVDLTSTDSEGDEGSDIRIISRRKLPDWAMFQERQKGEGFPNYSSQCQSLEEKSCRPQEYHGPGNISSSYKTLPAVSLPSQNQLLMQGALFEPEHLGISSLLTAGSRLIGIGSYQWASQGISSTSSSEGFPQASTDFYNRSKRVLPQTLAPKTGTTKVAGETTTHRVLKDLNDLQFKDEASLDIGLLAVPLLKHQRMALAWMEKKERGAECPGGILADDQGLGKTVSTIALILKARPPASKSVSEPSKQHQGEAATVNLDDDEDEQFHERKPVVNEACRDMVDRSASAINECQEKHVVVSGGRPSAGSLVVCPTSVLRQWLQELKEKVTQAAGLSVLIYHGSNRTRDPMEIAKYDVVLTTYSIVSMEVPKQPLPEEREIEDRNPGIYGLDTFSLSANIKRRQKVAESMKKKRSRSKNGDMDMLDHPDSGPLAKVAWFRVILDEAQNIKNRRTQVARACWGLRAKRRWCLSGTPIQNTIDDLYSYFRFLKYDPYAAYKSFCLEIKEPIARNPSAGYRKLQFVLQNVMLRRTKASMINGEPIINLPPKTVQMKQVDFSQEERIFYSNLEIQSRKQFQVYAAAGTLQKNYVNILWMLLRLRQACDHPFLVRDHHEAYRSSIESTSKLSAEKRAFLLAILEGNAEMCSVCMDAPEEPVISFCAHVFCWQCISQRLNHNDDACCPHQRCHTNLNSSLVYSLSALKSVCNETSGPVKNEHAMDSECCSKDQIPECSSKIKAVIETLRALLQLQPSSPANDNTGEETEHIEIRRGIDTFCNQHETVTEKALVFSQWTSMLDLLEVSLKNEGFCYRRLDGTMSVSARDRALSDFKLLPEVTVMIMSLKAASLGLNMVVARHVLLIDVWWNPTTEDQAVDRVHRIGQTFPVTVSRFTVKNTIEDRVLALQDHKRQIVASAFGEDVAGEQRTRLTVEDMRYLFHV